MDSFEESEHPRDRNGRFTFQGNGSIGKLREKAVCILSESKGTYMNSISGETAYISGRSIDKLISGKALKKSIANGFTAREHFEAVTRAGKLFRTARLASSAPDKNGSPDIVCVKRYDTPFKMRNGKLAKAHLTVKEYKNGEMKIYSLELMKR